MDGFWLYMMVVSMIIPLAMICMGSRMSRKPPENMDSVFGYRTKRAKMTRETWEFANKHCGRTWHMLGIALAVLTIGIMRGCYSESRENVILIGGLVILVQIFAFLISMLPTGLALRRNFDENGKRRAV